MNKQYIIIFPEGWPEGSERVILCDGDMYAYSLYLAMRDNVRGAHKQLLISAGRVTIEQGKINCFGKLSNLEDKPSRGKKDEEIISNFLGY